MEEAIKMKKVTGYFAQIVEKFHLFRQRDVNHRQYKKFYKNFNIFLKKS